MIDVGITHFIAEIIERTKLNKIDWRRMEEYPLLRQEEEFIVSKVADYHVNSIMPNSFYFEHNGGIVFLAKIGHINAAYDQSKCYFMFAKINNIIPIQYISYNWNEQLLQLVPLVEKNVSSKYSLPDAYNDFFNFDDGETYAKRLINGEWI